jgi:hypothetical protein
MMIETGVSFDVARTVFKGCMRIRQSLQAAGTSKEEVDKAVGAYRIKALKMLF